MNGTKLSPLFWKMLHSSITWLKKFTSLGKLKNHVSWFFSISFKNLNLERTTSKLVIDCLWHNSRPCKVDIVI